MRSFHESYRGLLQDIMDRGYLETNARTGVKIKALAGGVSFNVHLGAGLPVVGNRRYWPHIAAAEMAWQLQGTKNPAFILQHAPKLWSKFLEPVTPGSEATELKTAYGYRWKVAFGRDQLSLGVEALAKDPTNRQVFIQAWDPRSDGLGQEGQPKNIPCPLGFTINCVGDKVHMSVFVRSSDVFVGLPYDVMCYALTLDSIAATLNKAPGVLTFSLAHAHLYEPHFKDVEKCLKGDHANWADPKVSLPAWSLDMVAQSPTGYVQQLKTLAARTHFSVWDPQPILVE